MRVALTLLFAATGLGAVGRTDAAPAPVAARPLSSAERAAVELVVDYARRGPPAFWERLAEDSPLRALDRGSALAELGVRAGPPAGASWRLETPGPGAADGAAVFAVEFPSGVDDTLVFELVERDGWRLRTVRSLADPAPLPPALPAGAVAAAASAPAPGALALTLCAVALGGVLLPRRARLAALVVATATIVLTCGRASQEPAPVAGADLPRLGELEPLRRALALGEDAGAIERELARPPADPALARVRDLWRAQLALAAGDLASATAALGPERPGEALPLAALLHARLALQRLALGEVANAYRWALEIAPDHDGLRLEALFAEALTDEDAEPPEVDARLLLEMGSREAEPWYLAAVEAARAERDEESASLLRSAWALRPLRRDELFDDPALVAVVARPAVFSLLALGSPTEPAPAAVTGSQALTTAGEFSATLCGRELRLARADFELLVPGGDALAPAGVRGESAAERQERIDRRGLEARPAIIAASLAGGHLGPRLLRLADDAATALAQKHAWSDLIALTDGLAAPGKTPPVRLARLRALALERVGRSAASLAVLVGLAERELGARRPAPGVLFDLADAFARRGDYERAIRLVHAADRRLPVPRGEGRLRQFEMSRDLARDGRTYRSSHFDIRYPKETGERYARQLAAVFEAERSRLLHWIPRPGDDRVTVELFPLMRFLYTYGGHVAGVTQLGGPVRLPFADLKSLDPELVSILSHELAHALLDDATQGRAPHWFHEGLAQHVQMGVGPVNPLPELEARGRGLSVPVLEPVIAGFADQELVDIAYAESAWTVGFLEARWGLAALHRLEAEFAADRTDEQAIAAATGLSLTGFDGAFRRWALEDRPRARAVAVRRYDVELDSPLAVETGESELPRVSSRPRPAAPQPTPVSAGEMRDWHRFYSTQSAAVRRALAPVVSALEAARAPAPRACTQLAAEAARLLGTPRAMAVPDPRVAATLAELYRGFEALGTACAQGELERATRLSAAGKQKLDDATRALAPYGLRP